MGVVRPRTWRLYQVQVLNFLVSCYREGDGNVQRGVGASFLFLPSCANVVEISLRPTKKKSRRLLNAGYKGQQNKDKT